MSDCLKYTLTRNLLSDLERRGDDGWLMQRRLLTNLCHLRSLPDRSVVNTDKALQVLRELKQLALEHHLVAIEERERTASRDTTASQARERAQRLEELLSAFGEMFSAPDHQACGYDLEQLLVKLFELFGLRYHPPYSGVGEQVDGHFAFGGFDYIVEARWRDKPPTLEHLLAFKGKVDRKIASTRGFFVSMAGFRPEVTERLRQAGPANLILMNGEDLTFILDGRITLPDGLQAKVDRAAQHGTLFFRLASLFDS